MDCVYCCGQCLRKCGINYEWFLMPWRHRCENLFTENTHSIVTFIDCLYCTVVVNASENMVWNINVSERVTWNINGFWCHEGFVSLTEGNQWKCHQLLFGPSLTRYRAIWRQMIHCGHLFGAPSLLLAIKWLIRPNIYT